LFSYVGTQATALRSLGIPLYGALGPCDSNALNGCPEPLTLGEQARLYLARTRPRYFVDVPKRHLRMVFLDSFDPSCADPFGYSDACVAWLADTLANTPRARRVLVFSHVPPLARLMSPPALALRGSDALMELLSEHASQVLALVHAHASAESFDNGETFPIIAAGGGNGQGPDDAAEAKEPQRACWDIMLVNPVRDTLRFVRLDAGGNRIVEDGEARWL
ncbi:MAG: hypothetical protein LBD25_04210, partial [Coriobacteriales bacterium]|nr:hypothetical protein [Coriobacteriales bacterium]